MAQNASVPAETDILCEHCGYGLNGLPTDGRCPECGELIADSTVGDGRNLSPWESSDGSTLSRFVRTTRGVIGSPTVFFRHLQTRPEHDASQSFASRQHWLSSIVLGLTAAIHANIMGVLDFMGRPGVLAPLLFAPVFIVLTRIALGGITKLASVLTRVEGGYWGYRMPGGAVRRVMNFHTAQLLPVAVVAFLTVSIYSVLRSTNILNGLWDIKYLVIISIEVLLGAGYLFRTYWIAMKNIMYANR